QPDQDHVVRQLVYDAQRALAEPVQTDDVTIGRPAGRLLEFRSIVAASTQLYREMGNVLPLAGAVYTRMAGANLLDEGGAGTRHANDEHGQFGNIAGDRRVFEILMCVARNQSIDRLRKGVGVEVIALVGPGLPDKLICSRVARKCLVVAARIIEQAAQRKAGCDAVRRLAVGVVADGSQLFDDFGAVALATGSRDVPD